MIITISGTPGSGKGTVGRLLAQRLGYRFYSMGDIRRKYAQDRGMSIEELNEISEKDPASDNLVDEYQEKIGEREDKIVIDSRLGFHFIPHSFKIFLDADERTRAQRIMNDSRSSEKYKSIEDAVQGLRKRQESDEKRYKNLYNANPYDKKSVGYDLIVDTSENKPEELVEMILKGIKKN